MKLKLLLLFSSCSFFISNGQIATANQFPTMHLNRILDDPDLNEDIAFAYGLRLLRTDYSGPLIRLRRASDDSEEDFYCNEDDKIDIAAIDAWRSGSDVFIVRVYDQSAIGRDAYQTNTALQPEFIADLTMPYWVGDGSNDVLIVSDTFAEVTENGANGAILGVLYSTNDRDIAFGGETPGGDADGRETWYAHINWSSNPHRAYFDPGYCCNSTGNRSFINSAFSWDQYTFIRRDDPANVNVDRSIGRMNGTQMLNGAINNNRVFDSTDFPFGICAIITNNLGTTSSRHSDTRFTELIMYNRGKADSFVQEVEENQIIFWDL